MNRVIVFIFLLLPLYAFAEGVTTGGTSFLQNMQDVIYFWNKDVYSFTDELIDYLKLYIHLMWLRIEMWSFKNAVDLALLIAQHFNISSYIETAFNEVPSKIRPLLLYLKMPESINIMLSASIVRYVMGR